MIKINLLGNFSKYEEKTRKNLLFWYEFEQFEVPKYNHTYFIPVHRINPQMTQIITFEISIN